MAELFANSRDPDQMPHSVASDLGLHCLPFTLLGVSRLHWVRVNKELYHNCGRLGNLHTYALAAFRMAICCMKIMSYITLHFQSYGPWYKICVQTISSKFI